MIHVVHWRTGNDAVNEAVIHVVHWRTGNEAVNEAVIHVVHWRTGNEAVILYMSCEIQYCFTYPVQRIFDCDELELLIML